MQLAYLKNLQLGDVKGKKFLLSRNINNSMFVARQIIPCATNSNNSIMISKDEKLDVAEFKIYNEQYLDGGVANNKEYKKGPILGFVDISEKTFGLPSDSTKMVIPYDTNNRNNDKSIDSPINKRSLRPVLTNLSVKPEARKSGVGSALVDACESVVQNSWSTTYDEIVLEVEEENVVAQKFYEKRGYVALYADPSTRRYDTNGIILRDVRTTKICYRKDLKSSNGWGAGGAVGKNGNGGGMFNLSFFSNLFSKQ